MLKSEIFSFITLDTGMYLELFFGLIIQADQLPQQNGFMTAMDLLIWIMPYITSILHGYSYRIIFFNGNIVK